MAFDNDPVGNRLVASLARPGGNITGLSNIAPEISGKQLELLKEIVPQVLRVTLVGNSKEPANQHSLNEAELAASALKIKLHYVDIGSPEQIDGAFDAAIKASERTDRSRKFHPQSSPGDRRETSYREQASGGV
jgi:putative ABC transport system substrate-binding protein